MTRAGHLHCCMALGSVRVCSMPDMQEDEMAGSCVDTELLELVHVERTVS